MSIRFSTNHRDFLFPPKVATATRTLIAAGFTIEGSERSQTSIEIRCWLTDRWGAVLKYLVAISDDASLQIHEVEAVQETALQQHRVPIIVCAEAGPNHLSWDEFTDALGGVVPNWLALNETYRDALLVASTNKQPAGTSGEVWLIFENLVADGFEFMFGKRALRQGGAKRGKPVSDVHVQTPSGQVLVLDAKATGSEFSASMPALRPLADYVRSQTVRQRGEIPLAGAAIIAPGFLQDAAALSEISLQFNAEVGVPACFLTAVDLGLIIDAIRDSPDLRPAIRWNQVFKGGLVTAEAVTSEIAAIETERMERG